MSPSEPRKGTEVATFIGYRTATHPEFIREVIEPTMREEGIKPNRQLAETIAKFMDAFGYSARGTCQFLKHALIPWALEPTPHDKLVASRTEETPSGGADE